MTFGGLLPNRFGAAVWTRTKPVSGRKNVEAQRGITRLEMATVVMLAGLLAAPLLALAPSSLQATRTGMTEIALERARDALIEFAAQNNGCLPFAADYEGGLIDTDEDGNYKAGTPDNGVGAANLVGGRRHAGDLPWATLGLKNSFLDGEQLRIQYYVATPYTGESGDSDIAASCGAGFRGTEWNPSVTYNGSVSQPDYVYYAPSGSDRRLYKITSTLPAGTPPDRVVGTITEDVTNPLPASLLEVRRGPDVTSP